MSKKWFSDREFYRNLVRLTLPISFQSLMLASVAAGDAVMLGHIAQDSMAAVSDWLHRQPRVSNRKRTVNP